MTDNTDEKESPYEVLADGSVVCTSKNGEGKPRVLKPDELWKALLIKPYTDRNHLLGRQAYGAEPRIIAYRFGNDADYSLIETTASAARAAEKGKPPLVDLSGQPAFQAEVRNIMDEMERVIHVKFVPAEQKDKANLVIGYANRWSELSYETDATAGHASYPDSDGFSRMSLMENPLPDLRRTIRHELGHALGLNHPRNYRGQLNATTCDVGLKNDIKGRTIMSYAGIRKQRYGEDDVQALQLLYGPSHHPQPYVVPPLQARIVMEGSRLQLRLQDENNLVMKKDDDAELVVPFAGQDVIEIESTSKDERLTVIDPKRRVRFFYRGGHDALNVQGKSNTIGIVGEAAASDGIEVKMEQGNNFFYGVNEERFAQGKVKLVLQTTARELQQANIQASLSNVTSGQTGYATQAQLYKWGQGDARTMIAVPTGVMLEVVDMEGQPVVLPPLPAKNADAPPQRPR